MPSFGCLHEGVPFDAGDQACQEWTLVLLVPEPRQTHDARQVADAGVTAKLLGNQLLAGLELIQ